MTGVEFLATQEVVIASSFNWVAFFIVTFGLIAVFTVTGWVADADNSVNGWLIGLLIGGIVAFIFGISVGCALGKPTEYETQYKVTISDEVPMNEFLERYEIIDQEGKIYTVREKNHGK